MGIPSYFSYIVKNHSSIIKKLVKNSLHHPIAETLKVTLPTKSVFEMEKGIKINSLYLDCNSIIYDSVHHIDFAILTDTATKTIIKRVISKIEEYINLIEPDNLIYIAFDGVAPVAKLEQQRIRRYKSWYQNEISNSIFKKTGQSTDWNTTAITPGTQFMDDLNIGINEYFDNSLLNLDKYKVQNIIVSTSNEVGEGEHKIFEYIRTNSINNDFSVIYGLDADLIMLSINHLPINKNIYLFRETPEFIKSIDNTLEPNETYLLDIPLLTEIITLDMNNGIELTTDQQKNRIYDYIFLCFFLGNDFMPHFPAVNIRTGGIDKMINAYKATIGSTNENLTDGKRIYWKNVRKMVEFLAKMEEEYIKTETKLRDKREKFHILSETPEQKYMKFEAIPTYERELEKYINPYKISWQSRYYKCLLNVDRTDERCKQISINYLQGLEWTMKYYTTGCPDWRWTYQYNYPPLLEDLVKYIPYFDTTFIKENTSCAVSPYTQLCYVLPRQSLHFLPEALYATMKKEHLDWYPIDCEFIWAYSRYFWESHVELPDLDILEIEDVVNSVMK